MKVALVFFYSDNTLLIAKQSQCVLRSSFQQGQEVEVKCGGCPYVALILRTADTTKALEGALKKGLDIIDNCLKNKGSGCDYSEWQSKLVDTLLKSLPVIITETVLPEEQSSKGRKRKAVNYNIVDSPSDPNDDQDGQQDQVIEESDANSKKPKKKTAVAAKKATKKVPKETESIQNKKKSKSKTATTKESKKKAKRPPVLPPDVSVDDDEATTLNTGVDLTKDVPGLQWTPAVGLPSTSLITRTETLQASQKPQSGTKVRTSTNVGLASKQPKTSLTCPRPTCKDTRRELASLKEKYGALEAKYKKLLNELEESRKHPQRGMGEGHAVVPVQPGKVNPEIAAERKMIELIGGSGIFLYKSQLAMCKSSCKSRSSLACQLLKVFFTEQELLNGKLSQRSGGDNAVLDPEIVNVIKAYCSSTSFKNIKEEDIKRGHKKGLMHAMNLSIKQLQRRASTRKKVVVVLEDEPLSVQENELDEESSSSSDEE